MSSSSSSWYLDPQEVFQEEEFLDLDAKPDAHCMIREISHQQSSNLTDGLSTTFLPSGVTTSASSSYSDISSILSDQDRDNHTCGSLFSQSPLAPLSSKQSSLHSIDKLSLALVQNQVSQLAKASIKSLIISTDYRFGQQDQCSVPLPRSNLHTTLSFPQFLKSYLLTEETVPNLQYLRIIHSNPGHFHSRLTRSDTQDPSSSHGGREPDHRDYEENRLQELAYVLGNFLGQQSVRLSLDCAMLYPVQLILESSPGACECLHFLHVDILQTSSQHQVLGELLNKLPNLEVLSIKTKQEARFDFDFEEDEASDDDEDDDEDILHEIDNNLFKSCQKLTKLKTLILKATSLIESFSAEFLPPSVTHLELESNYNNATITSHIPSDSSGPQSSMAQFNNLWCHIFSHDLSQLTTLSISLWNTELFSSLPAPFFALPSPPSSILPHHAGNLQDIHIEGDYVPPGLDSLMFASNPHLKRIKIPIIYAPGAHALAEHCHDSLEELTVFGIKNSFYHPPDFLDFRLLPLLARCHKLKSLYINVSAKSLHGFDVLHLLAPFNPSLNHTDSSSSHPLRPPVLASITIEQSDFDLPYYKELITEQEYDEYGGFGMLPLELIKKRLPLYNKIRTTFLPAEDDLSGIQKCLYPIDDNDGHGGHEEESTARRWDADYKQYYSTVPYARYNCIFRLDIGEFLSRNAFLFNSSKS